MVGSVHQKTVCPACHLQGNLSSTPLNSQHVPVSLAHLCSPYFREQLLVLWAVFWEVYSFTRTHVPTKMASHRCIWVAFYKGVYVCRSTPGFCSQVYLMPPCIKGFSPVSFKTPPLRVTPGPGAAVLTCEPCTGRGGPIVPSLSALGLYSWDVGRICIRANSYVLT